MNEKRHLGQKERRFLKTIEKFREFNVLTELDLAKLIEREAWILNYIDNHQFFSIANLVGNFMLNEWEINLQSCKSGNPSLEMKKHLIYLFRPLINDLFLQKKITRYNTKTYKVRNI